MLVRWPNSHAMIEVSNLLVKHTTLHVHRQCLGEFLWHGQFQVVHDLREAPEVLVESSVHRFLLGHSRHGLPRVVVAGVQQEVFRQREDLLVHGPVQRFGAALREVSPPAPAYEQGVSSES